MALVRVLPDGSAAISTGAVEIGQGSGTVLSQIAAEELGLPLDRVKISQSDTSSTLLERTTNASRTTTIVGLAMQRACRQALDRLREMAAEQWSVSVDDIRVDAGRVMHESGKSASFTEILDGWFGTGAGEAIGIGIVRRVDETAAMPPFWEVGMSGVIVAIDETTCRVDVTRLVTVGDVGFAINPAATEGQDLGAATQGLGAALFEELTYDGGQLVNPNVVDYRVPRMGDLPDEIQTVLAERADGIGPYGAKGGGEGALNPIGGAVAVAVSRALGVWSDVVRLPITPERVWHMMHGGDT
jgi:CO/xanthine dehydrogenase Mo-binding subunit